MKNKNTLYLILVAAIFGITACEKDLEVYHYRQDGLNFTDSLINFSFVYGAPEAVRDTVWVNVKTMGFLSEKDREVAFEQITTENNNAVAGTHYVAFEDPGLKSHYIIPAGMKEADIPIILLRDPSLEAKEVTLRIKVKDNDFFGISLPDRSELTITITDQLAQPKYWGTYVVNYFVGTYGKAKHRFLIESTGEKWDNDYLYNVLGFTETGTNQYADWGYLNYFSEVLRLKLADYNTERIAAGLDVLKEEDGTIVTI